MPCIIDTARDGDRKVVIDIFNHYVKNTFAAYLRRLCPINPLNYCAVRQKVILSWSPGTKRLLLALPCSARTAHLPPFPGQLR